MELNQRLEPRLEAEPGKLLCALLYDHTGKVYMGLVAARNLTVEIQPGLFNVPEVVFRDGDEGIILIWKGKWEGKYGSSDDGESQAASGSTRTSSERARQSAEPLPH